MAKQKLEDRLRKRAAAEATAPTEMHILHAKEVELKEIEKNLKRAVPNAALEDDESRFKLLSGGVGELQQEAAACQKEMQPCRSS